jgi:hypothetical protein
VKRHPAASLGHPGGRKRRRNEEEKEVLQSSAAAVSFGWKDLVSRCPEYMIAGF